MCVELFSLRDKVALVTGAGKGLGKSMALALSESGAHVIVVSRTLPDIEATAREIQENGAKALPIALVVTKEEFRLLCVLCDFVIYKKLTKRRRFESMNVVNITKSVLGCAFSLFLMMQGIYGNDTPAFPLIGALPPIGPLPPLTIPADNPQTAAKVELGKKLYFDPRLSGNNWISCATCHNPALGFTDGLPRMLGGPASKEGGRNSPTIINSAYNELQFWDGRAATLEEQALGPIQNPNEMFETLNNVVKKLSGIPEYVNAFKEVFGTGITADGIAKAIAAFERTIVFANSPFDRYMQGDEHAMSESAKRGMELFNGKAECIKCHNGPNFTDNKFHNIGVPADGPLKEDLGRYNVTKKDSDKGAFKTPTLRNITDTAPYMHNGFFPTLFEVVQFYNGGGGRSENKSPDIHGLNLTGEEVNNLIEFMKALTGELVQIKYDAIPLVYPNLPKGF